MKSAASTPARSQTWCRSIQRPTSGEGGLGLAHVRPAPRAAPNRTGPTWSTSPPATERSEKVCGRLTRALSDAAHLPWPPDRRNAPAPFVHASPDQRAAPAHSPARASAAVPRRQRTHALHPEASQPTQACHRVRGSQAGCGNLPPSTAAAARARTDCAFIMILLLVSKMSTLSLAFGGQH
jgi:hypothetical protein